MVEMQQTLKWKGKEVYFYSLFIVRGEERLGTLPQAV